MEIHELLIAFVAAVIASGIATWTGFGAATILTATLALFLELRQAIFVVAIFHGMHNVVKIVTFRQGIVWRMAIDFGLMAIAFSFLGSTLSAWAPVPFLKVALGIFLILDAGTSLLELRSSSHTVVRRWRAVVGGMLSGFVAGIIGTGGAIRAFFLHHFLPEKTAYIATSAVIAAMIDITRIPVYATQYPDYATHNLAVILSTVPAGFVGVLGARRLLGRVNAQQFQKVVLLGLFLMGILFLVQGVRDFRL